MQVQSNYSHYTFLEYWDPVQHTIRKLLNQENVTKAEWQDMFSINNRITSWVTHGSRDLLKALEEELKNHVVNAANRIHSHQQDPELLQAYVKEWANFYVLIEHLPAPFAFIERGTPRPLGGVNRSEAKFSDTVFQIRNIMYKLWNGHVFETIHKRLLAAALDLVMKNRHREVIATNLVVGIRESFVNYDFGKEEQLKMYRETFEAGYIASMKEFYRERALQALADGGILNYMAFAYEKLVEEEERGRLFLDFSKPDSFANLVRAIVDVLIVQFQDQMLHEAPRLISEHDSLKLRMMYGLMDKTSDGIAPLLNNLSMFIKSESLAVLLNNAENIVNDCEKYVEQLLIMFTRFSALVKDAFNNDTRFLTIRDQAFQEVVNNTDIFKLELCYSKGTKKQPPESKCPELLATYCDMLLKKSTLTKKCASEEIDQKLENVLLVLKYVSNKDVFMRFYKTQLSRRLIYDMSSDRDKEEFLVNRFRESGMPSDFVVKLYRMLQDMDLNKDFTSDFKSYARGNENCTALADSTNIKILNAGAWSRARERCEVTYPPEMEELLPEIEEYYRKKHNGRKLNWAHHWSFGLITVANALGKYEVEVSSFQISVLFAFNSRPKEKISWEGLKLATGLIEADLIRTVMTLLQNPKVKAQLLLTDCPEGPKHFTDSTKFWVNPNFAVYKGEKPMPRGRISLLNRVMMGSDSNVPEEHEDIVILRRYRIQEALVKIMKMRRRISQVALNNELIEILRHFFVPNKRLIKEQMEYLIDQKYVQRDPSDHAVFIYIT